MAGAASPRKAIILVRGIYCADPLDDLTRKPLPLPGALTPPLPPPKSGRPRAWGEWTPEDKTEGRPFLLLLPVPVPLGPRGVGVAVGGTGRRLRQRRRRRRRGPTIADPEAAHRGRSPRRRGEAPPGWPVASTTRRPKNAPLPDTNSGEGESNARRISSTKGIYCTRQWFDQPHASFGPSVAGGRFKGPG